MKPAKLIFALLSLAPLPRSYAQSTSVPASQPLSSRPTSELPPEVLIALAGVKDFDLDLDDAIYPLLDFVKNSDVEPGSIQGTIELADWREALERPAEFRGAAITIEGVVGRNKSWQFASPTLKQKYGNIWQLELSRGDQPITCTAILTNNAADIGLNSTIRVTGYLLMVRRFPTKTREREGNTLVLVAKAPNLVTRAAPVSENTPVPWGWIGGSVIAGLAIVWFVVRWAGRSGKTDLRQLRAAREAPVNLAEDLDQWASGGQGGGSRPEHDDREW